MERVFETARPRRAFVVMLADEDGRPCLALRFLHLFPGLRARFAPGRRVAAYGRLRMGPHGLEMVHPRCRAAAHAGARPRCLSPVYPARGPAGARVTPRAVSEALQSLARDPLWADTLTSRLRDAGLDVPDLATALGTLHAPPAVEDVAARLEKARQRLAADELTAHIVRTRLWRRGLAARPAPPLAAPGALVNAYLARLPWTPTAAQSEAFDEIRRDLSQQRPMIRILQGDVGSGKTLVATLAALHALEAGEQAVLLAPTEILARQHHARLREALAPLGVEVIGFWHGLAAADRRRALAWVAEPRPVLAVGTHALLESRVRFGALGLVIVDEQHRFGVVQRQTLTAGRDDGLQPHQLVMTATPIPRTLALALYGGIDLSTLGEMPPGRLPVRTTVLPSAKREVLMERLRTRCLEGPEQAYWVCPWIGDDEDDPDGGDGPDALRAYRDLLARFPGEALGLVHGRLPPRQRERTMEEFENGRIRVLVATTVVEVGVDVPEATIMVVEAADQLGLLQLHQLRGRVGRGRRPSHCVLLYDPGKPESLARLAPLARLSDGLAVARHDLETRGPGSATGVRQSGSPEFRVVDLARDLALIPAARHAAFALLPQGAPADAEVDRLLARWPTGDAEMSRTV